MKVANPPLKPLMIWDGECHFCHRWIERWREITSGRIDYESSHSAAAKFPEIPVDEFQRSVQFIETDGRVFRGAEAVSRSLGYRKSHRWLRWSYYHVPGVAALSEATYGFIARHRTFASKATRLLWGNDVRRPTYLAARRLFLRALGVVYLIAFISFWIQAAGLVGANGISPIREFLPAAKQQVGNQAYSLLPTLCWFNASDGFLYFLCAAGTLFSIALIFGCVPIVSLMVLFVCYESLVVAGQVFFNFQWDILLLEAGFFAIFLAPFTLWMSARREAPFSKIALFLLQLLLFKLMFMSGAVKLTSGDNSWWDLTALDYHYWTQPLPTVFGWYGAQTSEWLKKSCTFIVLAVETLVPFLIWAPRRLRFVAFVLFVSLQLMIAITGNYCFFNLLTIALCFLLLDDAQISRRKSVDRIGAPAMDSPYKNWAPALVLVLTLPLNAFLIFSSIEPDKQWPRLINVPYAHVEPLRIVNGYGLFRVMTKERAEIVVEGSDDGNNWREYEFKWKPGDIKRVPGWVAPHQPRLDWQMWFAALGTYRQNPWFMEFVGRLLKNSPSVTNLLERNPFPTNPPRYVRAILYDYRFTTTTERAATGAWWKREERGIYLPRVSIE